MRRAGILLHPSSLPGTGPCGALGRAADEWMDWMTAAGCSVWQVLPLNPVGRGFSPYDSPGSFALGTHLVDLPTLVEEGLLTRSEANPPTSEPGRVDLATLAGWHAPLVIRAANRALVEAQEAVEAFGAEHPWALEWARFQRSSKGTAEETTLAAQWLVHRQWCRVHQSARERGIQILGDLPIFVSPDGADTSAHRDLFRWRARDDPGAPWIADPVTGVPPDAFSSSGQVWRNPHYHWVRHQETDFAWWVARFRVALSRCDLLRVDHFRGLCAAWEIPLGDAIPGQGPISAAQGQWGAAPGRALFEAIHTALGTLPLIAEDLGEITPEVVALRETLGLPGMRVLQFGFDGSPGNVHHPAQWTDTGSVAYTCTHDNDTSVGWARTLSSKDRQRLAAVDNEPAPHEAWRLVRIAWRSRCRIAMAPMQDVLGLDSDARMNWPGNEEGNWRWRLAALDGASAHALAALTRASNRTAR